MLSAHAQLASLPSHSRMHEYVRHQRNKVHLHTDALQLQMPYNYKIQVFCGREFSRRIISPPICCRDTSSTPSSSPTLHRLPTSTTTTTTPSETDEAGRLRRAPLMPQRRRTGSWTDEAMDDADAIYTTATTHAWRTRAKTDDDDHNSLIGGATAS